MLVISLDFYTTISHAIWVSKSRDSPINIQTSNIDNWYGNRSAKTISSYVLSFGHGRRLNSTVSKHANNRKLDRQFRRWFRQYLFHMRYEHEGVEITLSTLYSETLWMDNGIDHRKLHHRRSCRLHTAGDWIRQYQIMLKNIKIWWIAAYGTHCTYFSEPSITNAL